MDNQQEILNEVVNERHRQDVKFGTGRKLPALVWLAILAEEFGEVSQAVVENHFSGDGIHKGGTYEQIRKELIQVAAVSVAMIESLDSQIKDSQHGTDQLS